MGPFASVKVLSACLKVAVGVKELHCRGSHTLESLESRQVDPGGHVASCRWGDGAQVGLMIVS